MFNTKKSPTSQEAGLQTIFYLGYLNRQYVRYTQNFFINIIFLDDGIFK